MQMHRMLCAGVLGFGLCATGLVGEINAAPFNADGSFVFDQVYDGRIGQQYDATPNTKNVQVYHKPAPGGPRDLLVENLFVHNVNNQKALDIVAEKFTPSGIADAFSSITVRNFETYNIYRDGNYPGLHVNHLRIAGGGWNQNQPTDVYLENIRLNTGDALPLLIQDGLFGTIHLKNVSLENTWHGSVQISTKGGGKIDKVIIEDSPGLKVYFMERDDTIGDVEIINSPGARTEFREYISMPGGGVYQPKLGLYSSPVNNWVPLQTYLDPTAVPEPGLMALIPLAGAALLRRRRRS